MSQAAIAVKQNTIDSLRNIVNRLNGANAEAASLMPELKVIFPQVADIAVATTTLAKADTSLVDTLHVALVKLRTPLGATQGIIALSCRPSSASFGRDSGSSCKIIRKIRLSPSAASFLTEGDRLL